MKNAVKAKRRVATLNQSVVEARIAYAICVKFEITELAYTRNIWHPRDFTDEQEQWQLD